jgi:hypothetical protein
MDDTQINNFISNLPQPIQDVIFGTIWQERTEEIGKKYSLDKAQIDTLSNDVLLVLAGIEKPDTFAETLMTDLNTSRLLAEQILTDLEGRVFDYALKAVEPKAPKAVSEKPMQTSSIPEIRPNTVPMVEKNVPQRMTPPSMRAPEPYGVPRFGTSSIPPKVETLNLNQTKPATPQEAMEAKMSNVTVNIGDNFAPQQPSQQAPKAPAPNPTANPAANPIRKSYTTDPYREPLN